MRVLTLSHFGEKPEDDLQVTLSAMNIKMTAAKDAQVQGRPVKNVTILFMDSDPIELNLSAFDLLQLETIVGSYGFFEEE